MNAADEKWDDGTLGRDAEYAERVDEALAGLDDALELQLISIRLQKKLIADLKYIADDNGIGYQPMIRDLLNRFVKSEMKLILQRKLKEIEAEATKEGTAPVERFLKQRAVG